MLGVLFSSDCSRSVDAVNYWEIPLLILPYILLFPGYDVIQRILHLEFAAIVMEIICRFICFVFWADVILGFAVPEYRFLMVCF